MNKEEKRLYKALCALIYHSVDDTGKPKKATAKEIRDAKKVADEFELSYLYSK